MLIYSAHNGLIRLWVILNAYLSHMFAKTTLLDLLRVTRFIAYYLIYHISLYFILMYLGMKKRGRPCGPARDLLVKSAGRAYIFNQLTRVSPPYITCTIQQRGGVGWPTNPRKNNKKIMLTWQWWSGENSFFHTFQNARFSSSAPFSFIPYIYSISFASLCRLQLRSTCNSALHRLQLRFTSLRFTALMRVGPYAGRDRKSSPRSLCGAGQVQGRPMWGGLARFSIPKCIEYILSVGF